MNKASRKSGFIFLYQEELFLLAYLFIMIQDFLRHLIKLYLCLFNNHLSSL